MKQIHAEKQMGFALLTHLGYNMWANPKTDVHGIHELPQEMDEVYAREYLRFDFDLFDQTCRDLASAGCNMVVLDVGEGIQYESHPELSVRGSVSKQWIYDTVHRLREMGIELIPKLNFSACHDQWMGEYGRMLSTTPYYQFCQDVIAEVTEAFDHPRLFHLGMDEETARNQQNYNFMAVRQGELWWHDFHFLASVTMSCGSRPWIWSDYVWHHGEEFLKNMPREVLQTNWFYGHSDEKDNYILDAFDTLEKGGFDQFPAGSTWAYDTNLTELADYLKPRIPESRMCGILQTVWYPMTADHREQQEKGVRTLAEVRQNWYR